MVPSEHALSVVYTLTATPHLFIHPFAQGGKLDLVLAWSCLSQDRLGKLRLLVRTVRAGVYGL